VSESSESKMAFSVNRYCDTPIHPHSLRLDASQDSRDAGTPLQTPGRRYKVSLF
jgi:hypothetical protein